MLRIHRFGADDGELLDRFVAVREALNRDNYYAYPEGETERLLIGYYAARPDYTFTLLLAESADGRDVGRVVVGRNECWSDAFFGLFECVEDPDVFSLLMGEAATVARDLASPMLHGPIDFNGVHNWQLLLDSTEGKRWLGDPFHPAYYPALFRQAGWTIGHRSVSGILTEAAQHELLDTAPALFRRAAEQGIERRRRGEASDAKLVDAVYQIVQQSFGDRRHHYVPIEREMFRRITTPLLALLDDPGSLTVWFKRGEPVGFVYGLTNVIERLCNPTGAKPRPAGDASSGIQFAGKTTAIVPAERSRVLWPAMLAEVARHSEEVYGHPFAWRRSNLQNPGTARVRETSRVTDNYASFVLELGS